MKMKLFSVSVLRDSGRSVCYRVRATTRQDAQQLAFALDGGWARKEHDASEMLPLAQEYAKAEIVYE